MTCTDDRRRAEARKRGFNGVDSVDVSGSGLELTVIFFGKAPEGLQPANFRVDGGRRVTGIVVERVDVRADEDRELEDRVRLSVDRQGDLSEYRLSVVEAGPHGGPGTEPHPGFDPRYASAGFTFRPECADLDCTVTDECPDATPPAPEIDYLSKDYASFRQLLLDRLSLTLPAWTERHVPDLGVTLVELLAAEGDRLSYRQDAVATEAYLGTARRRVSVRRHARLVDYAMHDGCAARAWVCLDTDEDADLPAGDFRFATLPTTVLPDLGPAVRPADLDRRGVPPYEVFEPVHEEAVRLRKHHSEIHLWTWGDAECCLPPGTTSATLADSDPAAPCEEDARPERVLSLCPGDVLVFEEVLGAKTGAAADADRSHRQAVRLVSVTKGFDELYGQPVLEVAWGREDALTFPFCVSAKGGPQCTDLEVGVARGNAVLVGHGRSLDWCDRPPERIEVPVEPANEPGCPEPAGFGCPDASATGSRPPYPPLPVRFSPALRFGPVTQTAPVPSAETIAAAQAKRLRDLPERARRRLTAIWRRLHHHDHLSPGDRAYLVTLFGPATVRRLDADHHPQRALRMVLARFDELLDVKLHRWAELVRRARAGYVLRFDAEGWEIGQSWGEPERDRLRETSPVFRGPASAATRPDPRAALPAVRATDQDGLPWRPRRDLLASGPADRDFVGEVDDDGVLSLRFGDGRTGAAFPLADEPGKHLSVRYRVGNGVTGNVGAEAISRIVCCSSHVTGIRLVRNPLPAAGGVDPEPVGDVRRLAPQDVTHRLLRAITAGDYATLAGGLPEVQRAAADLRWTGSWYEAQVAVDALGTEAAPDRLLDEVRESLFRYRRIGHDLAGFSATLVPLRVELRVRVDPGHIAGHVRAALRKVFAALFAPDALTFGTPIRASRLIAAAAATDGVRHAEVTKLARLSGPPGDALTTGVLPIGPLEVAQLDNDPSRPENGLLTLTLEGGR